MRLPNFIVIGGMKCGTTTLYRDLLSHPRIYLPDKELNFLVGSKGSPSRAANAYADCFSRAGRHQVCGDVSTTYSMLPDHPGVAKRAKSQAADGCHIIYLVREPVSRAISHHRHMHAWHGEGRMEADIDTCVDRHPCIVDYSRYAMQLAPWRDMFGDKFVHLVVFEEYIRDRNATMAHLFRILGVGQLPGSRGRDTVYNDSASRRVLNPCWSAIRASRPYRDWIRSLLPLDFRTALRRLVLPGPPPPPAPPSLQTVEHIIDAIRPEEVALRRFLKRDAPIWDFEAVRRAYRPAAFTPAA